MKTYREIIKTKKATLLPIAHDALTAKVIDQVGFDCMAIGGFGVAASGYGLPDLGLIGLNEIAAVTRSISNISKTPLLVDADTGYGNELNVAHTINTLYRAGAQAVFIEDQKWPKRCGHTKGKELVSKEEMVLKLKAAKANKPNSDFMVFARTDAIAVAGIEDAIARSEAYLEAGADGIFVEALETMPQIELVAKTFKNVPKMFNIIEGGKTPMLDLEELTDLGFNLVAYPLTSLLVTYHALENAFTYLKKNKSMKGYQDLKSFAHIKELLNLIEK